MINAKAEEAELGVDRVGAIVSEWMGHALLFENMLPSVLSARDRFLHPPKSGAAADVDNWRRQRLFPCTATLHIAGIADAPPGMEDDEVLEGEVDQERGEDDDEVVVKWKAVSADYGVRLGAKSLRNQ